MRPASSYQSPSMTPPDGYDVQVDGQGNELECSTEDCGQMAVEQGHFDAALCPRHLQEEMEWDRADDDKGGLEYPQFYDGTGKW
jgi:hypothetical protein